MECALQKSLTVHISNGSSSSNLTGAPLAAASPKHPRSLPAHRESLDNFRAVLAQRPWDDIVRYNLARSLRRVGAMQRAAGNDGEALRVLREGIEITRAMARAQPREIGWSIAGADV